MSLLQTAAEPLKEERKKLSVGQWLKKCFLPCPGVNTGCKERQQVNVPSRIRGKKKMQVPFRQVDVSVPNNMHPLPSAAKMDLCEEHINRQVVAAWWVCGAVQVACSLLPRA